MMWLSTFINSSACCLPSPLQAGKDPLPEECVMHPGRKVCKVDKLLAA
jgi:hypothetical protein